MEKYNKGSGKSGKLIEFFLLLCDHPDNVSYHIVPYPWTYRSDALRKFDFARGSKGDKL